MDAVRHRRQSRAMQQNTWLFTTSGAMNETVDIIDVQLLLSIDFNARRLSYATAGDTLGVLKARL
jgi:hypothetical protein